MKVDWRVLLVVNVLIIGTLVGLLFLFGEPGKTDYLFNDEWSLKLEGPNGENMTLTIEELSEMPSVDKEYFLYRGDSKESETAVFRGVSLHYLISDVLGGSSYTSVEVRAIDSYGTVLPRSDVEDHSDIIIAYLQNGETITGSKDGGSGPLRLIVPQFSEGDLNALKSVKFVTRITLS